MTNGLRNFISPMPLDKWEGYHNGNVSAPGPRKRVRTASYRGGIRNDFLVWDGEGCNIGGSSKPQHYVLFGASNGEYVCSDDLTWKDCLGLILRVGRENPDKWHVAYAFNYDVNMIVRHFSIKNLKFLQDNGYCYIGDYRIAFRPGKQFTVTRYWKEQGKKKYESVTIYDVFSFFHTSMLRAAENILGKENIPELVYEGKAMRGEFKYEELMSVVFPYWQAEGLVMRDMMRKFKDMLYTADLQITKWYGPGALANHVLRRENIQDFMFPSNADVITASQYAYAGGRFELFKVGRYVGPVYSYDINSAYPTAISKLPCLAHGRWVHHHGRPSRFVQFGVYHVRLASGGMFEKTPGPVFLRDSQQRIYFPWRVEGWYWTPEAFHLRGNPEVTWIEYWEFERGCEHIPFAWVQEIYDKRKQWKREGNQAELALKLTLNSLYGKMAQRVGWNEKKNLPPRWHQLEWAGWVTSYTRAALYEKIREAGNGIVGVETDGIYTTTDLGIEDSQQLGGWEVKQYDEIIYIQSGFYWLRSGKKWTTKVRGFDPGSISLESVREYLKTIEPGESRWPELVGTTTRFVGLGSALARKSPKLHHCRWDQNTPRTLTPGADGKRVHFSPQCEACKAGISPYDGLHDLVIGVSKGPFSNRHSLPWKPDDTRNTYHDKLDMDSWGDNGV